MTVRPYVRGQDDEVRADIYNHVCADEVDFVTLTVEDVRRQNKLEESGRRHRFIAELDGNPAGLGSASADPEWPEKKGFLSGPGVIPELRRHGIGTALLLALLEDLRRRGMTQAELEGDATAATSAFCAGHGFRVVRSYSEMRRMLDDLPAPAARTSPAAVERFEPTNDNLTVVLAIAEDAFSDYYNHRPWEMAGLKRMVADKVAYGNPTYYLFAKVGGAPAGMCWYGYEPKEMAQLGRKTSFVYELAVRKEHRHRGIAKALMMAGMMHLKSDGMSDVQLWVDDQNATGAKQLYERLGFSVIQRSISYLKDIA